MAYWQDRQKQLNDQLEKDEEKLKDKLSARYDVEQRRLEKEIAAFYQQYGEDNIIEYRTLMHSLSDADRKLLLERMDDFEEKYPQYAHLMPVRESIYKLNRLEGLQASIMMHQLEIGAIDQAELQAHLERVTLRSGNAAAEQLGFGKNFYSVNSDLIAKTINQQWADGKNFSERIWSNRQKLADYLNNDFAMSIARGDSYERCIKALGERFSKVSRNDIYRLIYTEGTFVQNEATMATFEQDFEQYKISIADSKACEICKALLDQVFYIKDRKAGINFPPLHSWCRCGFTIEVSDWDKWMDDYVEKHGKEAKKLVQYVAKSSDNDIIGLTRKNTTHERFPASQERIDSLIEHDLNGVRFTAELKYNPRIRDNGKTTIREYSDGTVKEIVKIEIGKQDKSSAEFLEDTILHEELEARIAIRSKYSERYKKIYNSNDVDRHRYINKLIKKYFKIKGWNYELV